MNTVYANPASRATDVIVIGAGHAGLSASWELQKRGIEHVVLERGSSVAGSWKSKYWDSLRLLTPNWMFALPGYQYQGDDPDGFMSKSQVADTIEGYARHIAAPVQYHTVVERVRKMGKTYEVLTSEGSWRCRALVLANGAAHHPVIPAFAEDIDAMVTQITAKDYRNADQIERGGVLIVGASATGLQLAREIHSVDTPVTLSVGEHVRMPRSYRGKDIHWWMDAIGLFDERIDDMDDVGRARKIPSPQLLGIHGVDLDLNSLQYAGVQVVGKLVGVSDRGLQLSGSLNNVCTLADLKMHRLLKRVDEWIDQTGRHTLKAEPLAATSLPNTATLELSLAKNNIKTVIWATGFRPDFSWLEVPVFDRRGRVIHDSGILTDQGITMLGHGFQRTRKSSFIYGIESDAAYVSQHIEQQLDRSLCRLSA